VKLVKRFPDLYEETHQPEERVKNVSIQDELDDPGNYADNII
jgi:hypothetical protein